MKNKANIVLSFVMIAVVSIFIAPVIIVIMNSFKGQFYISTSPFAFPNEVTFAGLENFKNGIIKTNFFQAFGYSLWITVASTVMLILCCSLPAWFLLRWKTRLSKVFYYLLLFSMVVPFQMVMFTMSKIANLLYMENPFGIVIFYLGFGAGLCVFLYHGFIKGIPKSIEEAAEIDGCSSFQTFFMVIFPLLKPITTTVAVLNVMWIWNDYLLPYLIIGSKYQTLPVSIQYLQGGYGSRDMGALMAMLVLAIIPVIAFYIFAQKHVISGVIAGAVKE